MRSYLWMLVILSGCASMDNTYMGSSEYVTIEECRVAYRLGTIDISKLAECYVELPETLW